MIVDWDSLTVADLKEISRIAELTCGFEITAMGDGMHGEIRAEQP